MAKSKKIATRVGSTKISWRLMDAVLILLIGGFGSLSFYMYQDIRKDVNVLLHTDHIFTTEMVPKIDEQLTAMRSAIREINGRAAIKKAAPVKGKRTADGTLEDEADRQAEVAFVNILQHYRSANTKTALWDARMPASVAGQVHGKNFQWAVLQIALCFSWLLVIGSIVLLILKLIDQSARSQDNERDQF
jgi:hypothetical protein